MGLELGADGDLVDIASGGAVTRVVFGEDVTFDVSPFGKGVADTDSFDVGWFETGGTRDDELVAPVAGTMFTARVESRLSSSVGDATEGGMLETGADTLGGSPVGSEPTRGGGELGFNPPIACVADGLLGMVCELEFDGTRVDSRSKKVTA